MTEKKYLLTMDECNIFKDLHTVGSVRSFMKEHEYHENTCHMSLVPTWEEPSTYHCDRCHTDNSCVWNDNRNTFKPNYCPYCGAKSC